MASASLFLLAIPVLAQSELETSGGIWTQPGIIIAMLLLFIPIIGALILVAVKIQGLSRNLESKKKIQGSTSNFQGEQESNIAEGNIDGTVTLPKPEPEGIGKGLMSYQRDCKHSFYSIETESCGSPLRRLKAFPSYLVVLDQRHILAIIWN